MEGGACGLADGVGERKKNKKASCRSHSSEGRKKEDQDMGVIASGCRIAWHKGHSAGYSGTAQVAQCRTHRSYSHQGTCDI